MTQSNFSVAVVPGIPMVVAGDDLGQIIGDAVTAAGLTLVDGDVVCLAQKIVSKAEGQLLALATLVNQFVRLRYLRLFIKKIKVQLNKQKKH